MRKILGWFSLWPSVIVILLICVVTANYYLPPILRNLADDKKQMMGDFLLDQTSVYVTTNTESSHWHMYLVGSIVPFEQVELIKTMSSMRNMQMPNHTNGRSSV